MKRYPYIFTVFHNREAVLLEAQKQSPWEELNMGVNDPIKAKD